MATKKPARNEHLAATVVSELAARISEFSELAEKVTPGESGNGLVAIIRAEFAKSKTNMEAFAAFLQTPDDPVIRASFQLAIEKSADSNQEFRDQLASASQPHGHETESSPDSGQGTYNKTSVTHSTIRGRDINLGVLTRNKNTRIGLGLGGLAALLVLLGGGASIIGLSPFTGHGSQVTSKGFLADGDYLYTYVNSQNELCSGSTLLRWEMEDGHGAGSATVEDGRSSSLTVTGTPSSLTFNFTPSGQTATGIMNGKILTLKLWNTGAYGETDETFQSSTLDKWESQMAACSVVPTPSGSVTPCGGYVPVAECKESFGGL